MTAYAYATEWNHWTGRPTAENRWLTEEEARRRFEASDSLEVVSVVKRRESDGAVRGQCVIGLSGFKLGVRVQWLTAKHSIWRVNDYENIDGRLFRSDTTDYAYPDLERRYAFSECTAKRELFLRPDGTGYAVEDDKSQPTMRRADVTGYRTENLWMDFPQFGQWGQLADYNFGLEEEWRRGDARSARPKLAAHGRRDACAHPGPIWHRRGAARPNRNPAR